MIIQDAKSKHRLCDVAFNLQQSQKLRIPTSAVDGGQSKMSLLLLQLSTDLIRSDPNMNINKEIERRWIAEKERRVQLEKINIDMKKEIKKLKETIAMVN